MVAKIPIGKKTFLAREIDPGRFLKSRLGYSATASGFGAQYLSMGWQETLAPTMGLTARFIEWDDGGRALLPNRLLIGLKVIGQQDELQRRFPYLSQFQAIGLGGRLVTARIEGSRFDRIEERVMEIRNSELVTSADPDIVALVPYQSADSYWMDRGAPANQIGSQNSNKQWQWGERGVSRHGVPFYGSGRTVAVIDSGFDDQDPRISYAGRYRFDCNGRLSIPVGGSYLWDTSTCYARAHGTFCAGLIAARNYGLSGAAPQANLVAIGVDVLSYSTLTAAVLKCTDLGVDVISCSLRACDTLGGHCRASWPALCTELDNALVTTEQGRSGNGIPTFWSVENYNEDVVSNCLASHKSTIAIGGHDLLGQRAPGQFGPKVEFLAPSVDVFGTLPGWEEGADSGTSWAAPIAAGVAALLIEKRNNITTGQILTAFRNGPRPVNIPELQPNPMASVRIKADIALASI